MSIIEIRCGPVTHKYLMGKTKDEIAMLYMRMLRDPDAGRWPHEQDQARTEEGPGNGRQAQGQAGMAAIPAIPGFLRPRAWAGIIVAVE